MGERILKTKRKNKWGRHTGCLARVQFDRSFLTPLQLAIDQSHRHHPLVPPSTVVLLPCLSVELRGAQVLARGKLENLLWKYQGDPKRSPSRGRMTRELEQDVYPGLE